MQSALIRRAQATIEAAGADVRRCELDAKRQHDLLTSGIAGTQQLVEQADANYKRAIAQRQPNAASGLGVICDSIDAIEPAAAPLANF